MFINQFQKKAKKAWSPFWQLFGDFSRVLRKIIYSTAEDFILSLQKIFNFLAKSTLLGKSFTMKVCVYFSIINYQHYFHLSKRNWNPTTFVICRRLIKKMSVTGNEKFCYWWLIMEKLPIIREICALSLILNILTTESEQPDLYIFTANKCLEKKEPKSIC